jgi:hypothetical protein
MWWWFQSGAETSDETADPAGVDLRPDHGAKGIRSDGCYEIERLCVGSRVDQEVARSEFVEDRCRATSRLLSAQDNPTVANVNAGGYRSECPNLNRISSVMGRLIS